jgi:2-polyprenyl-6-methoxyphenol hydroxylase-like FAD-dependent oxidoreductase
VSTILVLGGGVIGLSMAMLLARQGHDVTVFERDSEPLPGSPEKGDPSSNACSRLVSLKTKKRTPPGVANFLP